MIDIVPFLKFASANQVQEDLGAQNRSSTDIHGNINEDSSIKSKQQLLEAVEFQKRSIDIIHKAVHFVINGGVVAFPTETVYGLGADATSDSACKEIFAIKQRPLFNPLIIHVAHLKDALKLAYFDDRAMTLARKFWPGPLTMILKRKNDADISEVALSGLDTIAIRIPSHPIALTFIDQTQKPIAAPSANFSGTTSITCYEDVVSEFHSSKIYVIPSQEKCIHGIESTIIDMSIETPTVLRLGFITRHVLQQSLQEAVLVQNPHDIHGTCHTDYTNNKPLLNIKSPGSMLRHYAPKTPLRINALSLMPNEIGLGFGAIDFKGAQYSLNLSPDGDLTAAASNLYLMLRALDRYALNRDDVKAIAVASIPSIDIGEAINDRLIRASYI